MTDKELADELAYHIDLLMDGYFHRIGEMHRLMVSAGYWDEDGEWNGTH